MGETPMVTCLEPEPELAINRGWRTVIDSPPSRTGCPTFDKLEQRDIIPLGCETLRATEVHRSNPSRGPCTRAPTSFTFPSASKEPYSAKFLIRSDIDSAYYHASLHLSLGLGELGCYRLWSG